MTLERIGVRWPTGPGGLPSATARAAGRGSDISAPGPCLRLPLPRQRLFGG